MPVRSGTDRGSIAGKIGCGSVGVFFRLLDVVSEVPLVCPSADGVMIGHSFLAEGVEESGGIAGSANPGEFRLQRRRASFSLFHGVWVPHGGCLNPMEVSLRRRLGFHHKDTKAQMVLTSSWCLSNLGGENLFMANQRIRCQGRMHERRGFSFRRHGVTSLRCLPGANGWQRSSPPPAP